MKLLIVAPRQERRSQPCSFVNTVASVLTILSSVNIALNEFGFNLSLSIDFHIRDEYSQHK